MLRGQTEIAHEHDDSITSLFSLPFCRIFSNGLIIHAYLKTYDYLNWIRFSKKMLRGQTEIAIQAT